MTRDSARASRHAGEEVSAPQVVSSAVASPQGGTPLAQSHAESTARSQFHRDADRPRDLLVPEEHRGQLRRRLHAGLAAQGAAAVGHPHR